MLESTISYYLSVFRPSTEIYRYYRLLAAREPKVTQLGCEPQTLSNSALVTSVRVLKVVALR